MIYPPRIPMEPLSFLFEDKKDIVIAEIGIEKCISTIYMLEHFDIKRYYAIDPFVKYEEYNNKRIYDDMDEDGGFEACYLRAVKRLKNYDNVTLIRDFSHNAVKFVKEEELDFCFIDGNHAFEYVKQDIEDWLPKVKKGGILSGDDIFLPEVRRAVNLLHFGEFDVFTGRRSWFMKKWDRVVNW